MARPLEGLSVLDLTTTLAGSYCTKLWVDAGADVLKMEPPAGDPLRRRRVVGSPAPTGDHSPLSSFLHAGKGSIVADLTHAGGPGRESSTSPRSADLLVESADPGALAALGLGPRDLRAANPELTIVSITPFGQTGPWAQRPATEFTLQAASGSIGGRGTPERPPVAAGGQLGDWIAGTWAAIGGLAAWRRAHATGRGDHVDVSALECLSISLNPFEPLHASLTGDREHFMRDVFQRSVEVPSIEPALDGWVGVAMLSAQQWQDFTVMIERPDLADDPGLAQQLGRWPRRHDVEDAVHAWTRHAHRRRDRGVGGRASAFRSPRSEPGPPSPLWTTSSEVGTYVDGPEPGVLWPRVPYRLGQADGDRSGPPRPAPPLGSGRTPSTGIAATARRTRHHGASARRPADRRLHRAVGRPAGHPHSRHARGGRGQGRIGPASRRHPLHQLTRSAGRTVVGVQLALPRRQRRQEVRDARPHPSRGTGAGGPSDRDRPTSSSRTSPLGSSSRSASTRTTCGASPRRPCSCACPPSGSEGPWRDRVGLAQTMEQLSGMANLTGFADGPPTNPRGPCDAIAGIHAAFAALVAIIDRDRTGRGQLVESVMVNAALNVAAEQVIEFSTHGNELRRNGNRSLLGHVQGVYACAGQRTMVGPGRRGRRPMGGLADWLGHPDWAAAVGGQSPDGRSGASMTRSTGTSARCSRHATWHETVASLTKAGVPAEAVVLPGDIEENPQHVGPKVLRGAAASGRRRTALPGPPVPSGRGPDHWFDEPPPLDRTAQRRRPRRRARAFGGRAHDVVRRRRSRGPGPSACSPLHYSADMNESLVGRQGAPFHDGRRTRQDP